MANVNFMMTTLDIILRIPPLFVMDEVLKLSFGFADNNHRNRDYPELVYDDEIPYISEKASVGINECDLNLENTTASVIKENEERMFIQLPFFVKVLCFITVHICANIIFLLSSQKLLRVYLVGGSVILVLIAYQANMSVVKFMISSYQFEIMPILKAALLLNTSNIWDLLVIFFTLAINYTLQGGLGCLFIAFHLGPQFPSLKRIIMLSFLFPTYCFLLPLSESAVCSLVLFAAVFPLFVVKYVLMTNVMKCLAVVKEGYAYAQFVLCNFGLHSLLESEWIRLNVPTVLRVFWLLRSFHHLLVLLGKLFAGGHFHSFWTFDLDLIFVFFKSLMVHGCDTAVSLLGMTSIISYISHYIGTIFQKILLTYDEDTKSMSSVCAILFFVLAEQSRLTFLEEEERYVRLCRNLYLLSTAMLHFVHSMVNPVLMSLSASHNLAFYRHMRALSVCLFLILFPSYLLLYLWTNFSVTTWLLAVSAFCIQVIMKTVISLLIYFLFLIVAYQSTFWEKLDDYVYYICAFGNSVEFIFGILLFFNGAWIYFFESGSTIRAFMMCIHAYFNIWCEAQNGWSVFMKRRTAAIKINSLPEATPEELVKHDDVCAICFNHLYSAKVTQCHHYFHSVCLRKWLYVQDTCPLCQKTLYKTDLSKTKPEDAVIEGAVEPQNRTDLIEEVLNDALDSERGEEAVGYELRQHGNSTSAANEMAMTAHNIEMILGYHEENPSLLPEYDVPFNIRTVLGEDMSSQGDILIDYEVGEMLLLRHFHYSNREERNDDRDTHLSNERRHRIPNIADNNGNHLRR